MSEKTKMLSKRRNADDLWRQRRPKKNHLALDTNVLITLSNQENFALEFLEVAREKRCELFVPPVAIQSLPISLRARETSATRERSANPDAFEVANRTFVLWRNRTSHC